jgi:hypothetical protein
VASRPFREPGRFNRERFDLLKLFRDKAPDAAKVLYDLMMDEAAGPAVRMACAVHWLDRAFGKPRQSVEVEQQGRSLEQILEAIAEAREAEAQGARGEQASGLTRGVDEILPSGRLRLRTPRSTSTPSCGRTITRPAGRSCARRSACPPRSRSSRRPPGHRGSFGGSHRGVEIALSSSRRMR